MAKVARTNPQRTEGTDAGTLNPVRSASTELDQAQSCAK